MPAMAVWSLQGSLNNGREAAWSSIFPYLPNLDESRHLVFWSNQHVYRTLHSELDLLPKGLDGRPVLLPEVHDALESGGVWLLNAIRKDDGALVGLYRRANRDISAQTKDGVRYTSAIAFSTDDGRTWVKQGAAVGRPFSSRTTDTESEITCMVFDGHRRRRIGIGHGPGYASHDPNAAPGTGGTKASLTSPNPIRRRATLWSRCLDYPRIWTSASCTIIPICNPSCFYGAHGMVSRSCRAIVMIA